MKRLLAELGESFRMALSAIASHKLRSGLTLLGVLVGVFSIILVMTAMRAMKSNIETNLGQLGSKSFVMQKMPGAYFGGPEGFMKFLRRKDITFAQAKRFQEKADFAPYVGLHATFLNTEVVSRTQKTPPNVSIEGVNAGFFQTTNWTIADGRAVLDHDVESARDVCVLSAGVAKTLFPRGSAVGERIKIASINYTVIGVFERTGSDENAAGVAAIPLTTGLNRFGRWRDTPIIVQALDDASFAETMEQARGLLRSIRKVPPGLEDDFEILSSDSMIAQFQKVTFAVRTGLALVSSIALIAAGVAVFIVLFARRIQSVAWAVLFGLLLGGTLGNLSDRLFREPSFGQGHVVDFLQLIYFPAIFNVADTAIVSSMVVFIILTLRGIGLDGTRSKRAARNVEPAQSDNS